jgi:tetratricopeptide (TPR) repeat protein
MMTPDDFFEDIEAYEEGRLTLAQRQQFDQQLQTDPTLKQALLDYRVFRHSIEAVDLKQRLNTLHDHLVANGTLMEPPTEPFKPTRRPVAPWRWVAAASVILAISVGVWLAWFRPASPTLAQAAFVAFYHPEPIMRGGNDCPTKFTPVIIQYRNQQYANALIALQNLPDNEVYTIYYRGLCYLALHDAARAISLLKAAKQQSNGSLQQRAEWYLALAYLANNDLDDGRKQLEIIHQQPEHPFGVVAKKILIQLKKTE